MSAAPENARGSRLPALCALALWIALFTMACRWEETPANGDDTAAGRVWNALRRLTARKTYLEADRYHHGGVDHARETAFETPLHRLGERLTPSAHVHVEGAATAEILPWLRWTVSANPDDTEAWRVAAYWVRRATDDPGRIRAVYREAARQNPRDYRIYLDWARQLLYEGAWGGAARLCDRALALWPAPLAADDEEAALDLARLQEWRGYLWAYAGDRDRALRMLEAVAAARPQHQLARDELERLRSGEEIAGRIGPGLSRLRENLDPHPAICDHDRP